MELILCKPSCNELRTVVLDFRDPVECLSILPLERTSEVIQQGLYLPETDFQCGVVLERTLLL